MSDATTIDSMAVELTANIGPLLDGVKAGLEAVRRQVQNLKDAGRVDITASIDQLLGSLGEAGARTKDFKQKADKDSVVKPQVDTKGFLSGLSSLKEKAESVARALGSVFFAAAGFREITNLFGEWIHASGEQEVALARLKSTLSATGAAGEAAYEPLKRQAEELAAQYGQFGDEAIQSGMAVLASFKLQQNQIAALTPVLMDAAVGLSKMEGGEVSLEQVAMLVGKAMNGHAEALQRLGIAVDATKFKLDPLGATMDALNRRFQGLTAAVAETDEGKLKAMGERWGEIKETLGQLVTAVLMPLLDAIKPVINAFLAMPVPVQQAAIAIGVAAVAMNLMKTSLIDLVVRLLIFIDTTSAAAVAAIAKFATSLTTIGWSSFIAGIGASITSLNAFIASMGVAGKAGLIFGAFMAGWEIGRWISNFIGLSDAVNNAGHQVQGLTADALAAVAAHLQHKWGITMTNEALQQFMQLSPQARYDMLQEAQAAGQTAISMEQLTAARKADLDAQQEAASKAEWQKETDQLNSFIAYYRQSRAGQIATDIAATKEALKSATLSAEERKRLEEKLTGLLRQAAQERVQADKDAADKSTAAAKAAHDEQVKLLDDLLKKYTDAANQKAQAWVTASKQIALDMLSERTRAEAEVRLKAKEYTDDAQSAIHGAQEKADAIARIQAWEKAQLAAIDDKYRLDTQQKEEAEAQRRKEAADRELQERQQQYDTALQAFFDPVNAWLAQVNATMDIQMGMFANAFVGALQPVGQAFTQFLATGKMNWQNALNQMKQYFASMFVSHILKYIAQVVTAWIFGERAKQVANKQTSVQTAASANVGILANLKAAGSAIIGAIAGIFHAHAHIPFVGVALALGFIALMVAAFAKLKKAFGFAQGGLVTGPTYGLVGEAGPEIIAPVADFKQVVSGLLQDTVAAVREAAWTAATVPPVGVGAAIPAGAGALGGNNIHLHGFALMDLGERATQRNIARRLQEINLELGRGIIGGGP